MLFIAKGRTLVPVHVGASVARFNLGCSGRGMPIWGSLMVLRTESFGQRPLVRPRSCASIHLGYPAPRVPDCLDEVEVLGK